LTATLNQDSRLARLDKAEKQEPMVAAKLGDSEPALVASAPKTNQ